MRKIGFFGSRQSPRHYFLWRKERALEAVAKLKVPLAGKKILDFGCGFGAVSEVLAEQGAEVWGLEQNPRSLDYAKEFVTNSRVYLQATSENRIDFPDNFFDIIILFDVLEHLMALEKTLTELKRVLKPGGFLYVESPPFYSITGHHLYDLTKLPIHLFWPDEKIKQFIFRHQPVGFKTPQMIWDEYQSCNKITVNQFRRVRQKLGLVKIRERFILKYPELFEWNLFFLGWLNFLGRVRDFFVMSLEGLYQKPSE